MKTCPYAISGIMATFDYYHREYYLLLDKAKHMTKEEYDGRSIHNETDGVLKSIICRGVDCGRYALCNPQSTQENQHDKKSEDQRSDMDYLYDLWISQRSYNILKRVVIRIGWGAANSMSIDSWLKEKGCGRISASEIWNALHGNKDDNA